mmetsp:Transcript_143782/g.460251  ORF Transcript_143782/g.460251 Transcript_143782/m.460251 type:complete len:226 (-) Transcript_143782:1154-1831(-)
MLQDPVQRNLPNSHQCNQTRHVAIHTTWQPCCGPNELEHQSASCFHQSDAEQPRPWHGSNSIAHGECTDGGLPGFAKGSMVSIGDACARTKGATDGRRCRQLLWILAEPPQVACNQWSQDLFQEHIHLCLPTSQWGPTIDIFRVVALHLCIRNVGIDIHHARQSAQEQAVLHILQRSPPNPPMVGYRHHAAHQRQCSRPRHADVGTEFPLRCVMQVQGNFHQLLP